MSLRSRGSCIDVSSRRSCRRSLSTFSFVSLEVVIINNDSSQTAEALGFIRSQNHTSSFSFHFGIGFFLSYWGFLGFPLGLLR